jgi:anthranilate phosphoribosyltransferase
VTHDGSGLLEGMPPAFMAARYHSLAVDPGDAPARAARYRDERGRRVVMGIRHVALPLEGVQFHPESVLTPQGPHLLANFLRQAGEGEAARLDEATGSFATCGLVETDGAWPGSMTDRGGDPMSELVRSALATIVDGGTLSMDEAQRRDGRGDGRRGDAGPARGVPDGSPDARRDGRRARRVRRAMRDRVVRVDAPEGAIDVVGTGGDGSGTFNISTTAALVTAAAGVPVAKHGNRAMTSKSGSADVLEALGIRIDHDAASAGEALRKIGFAFLFAPAFHPAMRHAGPTRREIGVRTGVQPGRAADQSGGTTRQLLGVANEAIAERMAEVVVRLGTERTFVIHGDGVDELPLDGSGVAWIVAGGTIERHPIDAAALGFKRAATTKLAGGHARGERPPHRGRAQRRARRPARRGAAQRRGRAARGRGRRPDGGGDRAAALDDRRGPRHRAAGRPSHRATGSRGSGRGSRGLARMTVAERPPGRARRRAASSRRSPRAGRADIAAHVAAVGRPAIEAAAVAAPAPRPIVERLAAPGLHLIAEIKRSSPSAGRIAAAGDDVVARARAYEAGGAAAISVLCEPHWFAGSVDDLRAARAAVRDPGPRKDFVVDEVQLPLLRVAGADLVLLLPSAIPRGGLRGWSTPRSRSVSSRSSRSTTQPSSSARWRRGPASSASITAISARWTSTSSARAGCGPRSPDDRLVVAESGVRESGTIARWRAQGFDAALVGEALVRAGDPTSAASGVRRRGTVARRSRQRRPAARS